MSEVIGVWCPECRKFIAVEKLTPVEVSDGHNLKCPHCDSWLAIS